MSFSSHLHYQCGVLADCFVLSGENSWGTKNFVRQLFNTEWGRGIITGLYTNEFTCEGFMYEGLLRAMKYKKGKVYPEKVLWYAGYFYRYLGETCGVGDIYEKAPIDLLYKRYGFYHTQDWDYVKMDLGL